MEVLKAWAAPDNESDNGAAILHIEVIIASLDAPWLLWQDDVRESTGA